MVEASPFPRESSYVHSFVHGDEEELREFFRWYVSEFPGAARVLIGWDPERDDPETADVSHLMSSSKIVRLTPVEPGNRVPR